MSIATRRTGNVPMLLKAGYAHNIDRNTFHKDGKIYRLIGHKLVEIDPMAE